MGRRTAMLNEKSGIWIKLYKLCIIIIFILCFPGCFFLGTLLRLTGFSYFCCIFLGLFVGILQWILNMLILNLVSNLQILREIEEKKRAAPGNLGGKTGAAAYQIIVGHGAWPQSFYHNRNKKRQKHRIVFLPFVYAQPAAFKALFFTTNVAAPSSQYRFSGRSGPFR